MRQNYTWLAGTLIAGLALAGCQSLGDKTVTRAVVTSPAAGEYVGLQDVMIVVDASGSMWPGTSFAYAKALTQSMVAGFPEGGYGAGLLSFGGEWTFEWTDYAPMPLNRIALAAATDNMRFLAGSTPLEEALAYVGDQYLDRSRARAIIVVSDGKADRDSVLARCVELAYGPAPLCIHTVQVGNDAEGGRLLADMARITPCGSFRHGDLIASDIGMDAFIREVFFQDLATLEMVDEMGVRSILGTVLFDTDKSAIRPEYNALLDEVAAMLRGSGKLFICAAGHTDSTGTNAYNMGLSQRRADAVYNALIARGANRNQVFTKAYGEEMPTAPNDTSPSRQLNRRVELKVIE